MEFLKRLAFVLGTWGVILGVPVGFYVLFESRLPLYVVLLGSLALLALGVFFGEWLSRLMNRLLGDRPDTK